MPQRAALPFHLARSEDEFTASTVITRSESVHGLLIVDDDELVIQWRRARNTARVGLGVSNERTVEAVRETRIPLGAVAGGRIRDSFWDRFRGPRFVLLAADLKAFDPLAGAEGLELEHPAELVLRIRRRDRLLAEEFAAELALALAERERPGRLAAPPEHDALGEQGAASPDPERLPGARPPNDRR